MKPTLFYSILIMVSLSLMSMTCSSDDDTINNDNSQEINNIINTVEDSTWRITSFINSDLDETNHFNGYNFTFKDNGTLVANNGNTTINGTWSVTDSSNSSDDSNDDSSNSNDIDFNISFSSSGNDNFDDLTEDWDIVTRTDTVLSLIHVSGGNGGTDTLIFNKN